MDLRTAFKLFQMEFREEYLLAISIIKRLERIVKSQKSLAWKLLKVDIVECLRGGNSREAQLAPLYYFSCSWLYYQSPGKFDFLLSEKLESRNSRTETAKLNWLIVDRSVADAKVYELKILTIFLAIFCYFSISCFKERCQGSEKFMKKKYHIKKYNFLELQIKVVIIYIICKYIVL